MVFILRLARLLKGNDRSRQQMLPYIDSPKTTPFLLQNRVREAVTLTHTLAFRRSSADTFTLIFNS